MKQFYLTGILTLFVMVCLLNRPFVSFAYAQNEDNDSVVEVIAWFDKRDSMTYWINSQNWKIENEDSVKVSDLSTKVLITVVDSTKNGYSMEYQFLDFRQNMAGNDNMADFQNKIVREMSDIMTGVSIEFKTDELGHILEYTNYEEVKKSVEELFDSSYEEYLRIPILDSLKSVGVDVDAFLKSIVNVDDFIDGNVEELELMFSCHGSAYEIGSRTEEVDASDNEYASNAYIAVSLDSESHEYEIYSYRESIIPSEDVKKMVTSFVGDVHGSSVKDECDSIFTEDAIIDDMYFFEFFPDGWPKFVVRRYGSNVMGHRKMKVINIEWEYRSLGNGRITEDE